jgi:hypothetical protein
MSEVARKVNNATQFSGSATVKVPTGGKKKKLEANVAATEAIEASRNPHVLAMRSTYSKYANPTVVALTRITLEAVKVMTATPAIGANSRNARRLILNGSPGLTTP